MRKTTAILLLAALTLASCGGRKSGFRLTGRLLGINQGQFYIYSAEGDIEGIDTIDARAGRFEYNKELPRATTLMIVFPNYTEQPIFAEPDASVKIDGDASHLKDMTAKGTADNELMNTIRPQLADATPQEKVAIAKSFIKKHPESRVGLHLVRRCILQQESPDFATARALVEQMLARQKKNGALLRMRKELQGRGSVAKGQGVPAFKATDIGDKAIDSRTLARADVGVIIAWATWNYESLNAIRQLNRLKKKAKGQLQVVAVALDTSAKECAERTKGDSIAFTLVCDEKATDSPLYRLLGLNQPGDCLVFDHGKLTARGLRQAELKKKVAAMLGIDPDAR